MSFDGTVDLVPKYAIEAQNLGKCYTLFDKPTDRLKQALWGGKRQYGREFWALQGVSFAIRPGEVVGLVGRNGAGKSTLLQMVCGTLGSNTGTIKVQGRVAALLELGGGFSPDFTGLENVYMNAAILGLKRSEVDAKLDSILAFADIGKFIHQPVKTYSSGMFMRLAFAVATSVEPDILVIDEALSVGDGAFARKSFDRIMQMKDAGKTILFCSHSMYQVEALCSRALWMEDGKLRMDGDAAMVTGMYQTSLNAIATQDANVRPTNAAIATSTTTQAAGSGTGRIVVVHATADGLASKELAIVSGKSELRIRVEFAMDPHLPPPTVAFGISDANMLTVASVISGNDGVKLQMDASGRGAAEVVFPQLPLLKGRYTVTALLLSEDGLHPYEVVERSVALNVSQMGLEQGLVSLPHRWI